MGVVCNLGYMRVIIDKVGYGVGIDYVGCVVRVRSLVLRFI